MIGFLNVIFIIVLSFYVIGFLIKLWLRWFIAKKQREFDLGKTSKGFYYSTSFGSNSKSETKKQGEINVEQLNTKEKKVDKKVGDYVDFEEVK